MRRDAESLNPIQFIYMSTIRVTEKGEIHLKFLIYCCLIHGKIKKSYATARQDKT